MENKNRTYFIVGLLVTVIGGGSLLIAGGLIYFFTAGPGAPQRPTEAVAVPTLSITDVPTEPLIRTRPPLTELANTPTPLPLSAGNNNPIADSSGGVGGNTGGGTFLESPSQSVVNYYRDITAGNYDSTWDQLSDGFKQEFNCCAPDYDREEYLGWWTTVDRVDFAEVRTVEQDGNTALVYAELIYTMEAGGSFTDSDPYIEL
ncbi:MAG: hypothetical protein AAF787_24900, partial [Chloroflexota bacterium]